MIPGHRPEAKPACPECGCTSGHRTACKTGRSAELERHRQLVADLSSSNDLLERRLLNVIAQNRELRARIHVMQETVKNVKANRE